MGAPPSGTRASSTRYVKHEHAAGRARGTRRRCARRSRRPAAARRPRTTFAPAGKRAPRDQPVAQPLDEPPRRGVAPLVAVRDDHLPVPPAACDVRRAACRSRRRASPGRGRARVDEPLGRGGASVDDHDVRRRDEPAAERVSQRVVAAHRLGRRRDPGQRARRQRQRRGGERRVRRARAPPAARKRPRPAHDRPRERVPERAVARRRPARRLPRSESSAGCSVSAAATETSGISRPPMPIERMNGTGTTSRSPSPTATAPPENATARPAVATCERRRRPASPPARELLAVAVHDEQRVVDGEPEPDQLDEVAHVGDHRDVVRDR